MYNIIFSLLSRRLANASTNENARHTFQIAKKSFKLEFKLNALLIQTTQTILLKFNENTIKTKTLEILNSNNTSSKLMFYETYTFYNSITYNFKNYIL